MKSRSDDPVAWEEDRHRCEVRYVLAMRARDKDRARDFIFTRFSRRVGLRRGEAVGRRLLEDCQDQWAKGNRGDSGVWL